MRDLKEGGEGREGRGGEGGGKGRGEEGKSEGGEGHRRGKGEEGKEAFKIGAEEGEGRRGETNLTSIHRELVMRHVVHSYNIHISIKDVDHIVTNAGRHGATLEREGVIAEPHLYRPLLHQV